MRNLPWNVGPVNGNRVIVWFETTDTLDLPQGNRTTDQSLITLSLKEQAFRFPLIINTVTLTTWCVEDAGLLFHFFRQGKPPSAPIKHSWARQTLTS